MAIETHEEEARARLRALVDGLPKCELDAAVEALSRLKGRAAEDAQLSFDEWLVATGRMDGIPPEAGKPRHHKINRLKISGKPVSQTIIEERG
jgi:hypothetical protein